MLPLFNSILKLSIVDVWQGPKHISDGGLKATGLLYKASVMELSFRSNLTHLFLMHLFSTPWKHQETLWFSDIFRR